MEKKKKTDKNQSTVRYLNGKRLLAAGGIKKDLIEMLQSELSSLEGIRFQQVKGITRYNGAKCQ